MGKILVRIPVDRVERAFVRRSAYQKLVFSLNGLFQNPSIRTGNWDKRTIPVETHATYRLMAAIVEKDFDPAQCFDDLFLYYHRKGRTKRKALERAERTIHSYIREYEGLYTSLKDKGYIHGLAKDEIGVAIDRAGRFVKVPNGNHRFYTAMLIGIEELIVEVRFVHRRWYRKEAASLGGTCRENIRGALEQNGMALC